MGRGRSLLAAREVESHPMPDESTDITTAASPFTAGDVEAILWERGWLRTERPPELETWLADAAALLGRQAAEAARAGANESAPDAGRQALADLLTLVFRYNARGILQTPEAHAVLARTGARAVIRELANLVLDGPEVGSDRFREIVEKLRKRTGASGREIFQPLRLALAGRAGGGEFDRVILLLDPAARLPFRARVKGTRERMLEFCSALD